MNTARMLLSSLCVTHKYVVNTMGNNIMLTCTSDSNFTMLVKAVSDNSEILHLYFDDDFVQLRENRWT